MHLMMKNDDRLVLVQCACMPTMAETKDCGGKKEMKMCSRVRDPKQQQLGINTQTINEIYIFHCCRNGEKRLCAIERTRVNANL